MSASNPGLGRRPLLLAGGLALLAKGAQASSEVVLYAYHLKPPIWTTWNAARAFISSLPNC